MSRTFIFLTLLFVSSYCIERKAANINQIVDELVELNKKIETPHNTIGHLVAQIGSAVEDSSHAFKAFYDNVHRNCETGRTYIKDFTGKLNGDLVTAKKGINDAEDIIKKAKAHIADYEKDIKKGKEELKAAHKRHQAEREQFRHLLAEAENKLIVIKHIRDIIEDELLNGKPASLLQVNTISSKLTELKAMLEKSNDTLFSTVVSSLLETVSLQNLNDQGILRKILQSLHKMHVNIVAWRKKAIADNKALRKIEKKQTEAKLKALRATGKLLVEARANSHNAHKNVEELKASITHLNNTLHRKETELKHWNSLCDNQAAIAKIFKDGRDDLTNHVKKVSTALLKLH